MTAVKLATKIWHALEIVPSKVAAATLFVASQGPGFESYAPIEPLAKVTKHYLETKARLRFSPYVFAAWPMATAWRSYLEHEDGERAGIVRVLCDGSGRPRPVPESVIAALRSYKPEAKTIVQTGPHFRPGENVSAYLVPGQAQQAVFIGWGKGGRAVVRIWIFGIEKEIEMAVGNIVGRGDGRSPEIARRA